VAERARSISLATGPRTAVVWRVLREEIDRRAAAGTPMLQVLDAGGGTGGFAVPLAELGHSVTVVDASPDALAALERRAAEQGVRERIRPVQGDVDSTDALRDIAPARGVDLVLCHSLLEVVDDPGCALQVLASVLRPGGAASLLVANRHATVLARALGGHFADAARALDDPGHGHGQDGLRRFTTPEAESLLHGAGLVVEAVHGVRVVADLVPGGLLDGEPRALSALLELEQAASERSPWREIATQLHLLARAPGPAPRP